MNPIATLAPEEVWSQFNDILAIPRPSGHEDAIRNFLLAKAKSFGIEAFADTAGNVIMRKGATPGMENRQGVILQAHMDMVPQKNADTPFDFEKDAIRAYIDGEWVTAQGTTLGADNGIGIAAILAVFASDEIVHGPIEALITRSEETGMDGAFGLQNDVLKGEILLNLDSESEGELCVGCAGGEDCNVTIPYQQEAVASETYSFELAIKGLLGGHSGMEIILERGNANKLLVRTLLHLTQKISLRIASIDGGGLRNAIPREAQAVILVPNAEITTLKEAVASFETILKTELKGVDDALQLTLSETLLPATVMTKESMMRVLYAVQGCPNGIFHMNPSIPGLVQTSTNLARIVSEDGVVRIQAMMRSASDSEKEYLAQTMRAVFTLAGGDVQFDGSYPGWTPNLQSPILKTMRTSYRELFGREAKVQAIHAGLECGLLGGKYPKMDMISFGPTICYPHSPDEKLEIATVEKFWRYLLHTLAHTPQR